MGCLLFKRVGVTVKGQRVSEGFSTIGAKRSSLGGCSPGITPLELLLMGPTSSPQPQMDEKFQLGPRVSWIKGSSGGAKDCDSGETTGDP